MTSLLMDRYLSSSIQVSLKKGEVMSKLDIVCIFLGGISLIFNTLAMFNLSEFGRSKPFKVMFLKDPTNHRKSFTDQGWIFRRWSIIFLGAASLGFVLQFLGI